MYEYTALVLDAHDGDTCRVDIDLGFKIWTRKQSLRLARIDAPKLSDAGGQESAEFLRSLIVGKTVKIQTKKQDKYGRYIAEIFVEDVNVNDEIAAAGHAIYRDFSS